TWRYTGWNRQVNRFGAIAEGKLLIERDFQGDKQAWFDAISRAIGNIVVQPVQKRCYPMGHVAGQLIGYVTERQEGITPGGGIELWSNNALAGDAQTVPLRDLTPTQLPSGGLQGKPALGVQLTIDADLQAFCEQALAKGLLRTESDAGVVVVMDSQTGDILALANGPVFDPDLYQKYLQPGLADSGPFGDPSKSASVPRLVTSAELPAAMAPEVLPPNLPPSLAPNEAGGLAATGSPAMDGRQPLLLADWPLSTVQLDAWTNPIPPALIPGIAPEHQRPAALIWEVEPGSIFKTFAMTAALEHHDIEPDTTFPIGPAPYNVPGTSTQIHDHHNPAGLETWTAHKVLVESSNKGMARIAMKTGRDDFMETFAKFHFGERMLNLPGEGDGTYGLTKEKWYPSELATIAFGQGLITATPLQLTAAMNAVATGSFIRPRLVAQVQKADGSWREISGNPREATFDLDAITAVQSMLIDVVKEGTGTKAAVPGYTVAGKTGTAWKSGVGGYTTQYLSSFLGYAPAETPRYTMIVMCDNPRKDRFGGLAAAPIFQEIMAWLLRRDAVAHLPEPSYQPRVDEVEAKP
ncbi:MAG: penicillin-binding transpeptidase domain-containing protein, partial [bacterium]